VGDSGTMVKCLPFCVFKCRTVCVSVQNANCLTNHNICNYLFWLARKQTVWGIYEYRPLKYFIKVKIFERLFFIEEQRERTKLGWVEIESCHLSSNRKIVFDTFDLDTIHLCWLLGVYRMSPQISFFSLFVTESILYTPMNTYTTSGIINKVLRVRVRVLNQSPCV
jgi:hypothetical protein